MSRVGGRDREQRASRVRPLLRDVVQQSSLRVVAEEVGVSHGTLHNMLEKGWTPYHETLDKIEAWVEAKGLPFAGESGPGGTEGSGGGGKGSPRVQEGRPPPFSAADVARRIDEVESTDASELIKLLKLAEIGSLARAREREEEREIARVRAEADRLGEEAARNRSEALRLAEEAAQDRATVLLRLLVRSVGEITEAGEAEELAMDMLRERRRQEQAEAERTRRGTQPE